MKLLIISALVCLSVCGCGINAQPGTGSKIGQITRVKKVGILNKTWEAELIRGGFSNGSGTVGTRPFEFTIETDAMAEQCIKYMTNQTEVVIEFQSEGIYSLSRTDSGGEFLTSIHPSQSQ